MTNEYVCTTDDSLQIHRISVWINNIFSLQPNTLRCCHSVFDLWEYFHCSTHKTASKHSNHKTTNDKATIPTKSNDLPQCTPTEYLTTQSMTQTKTANCRIQWKNGIFVNCVSAFRIRFSFEQWIDELQNEGKRKNGKRKVCMDSINERWHVDSISFYLRNSIQNLSKRAKESTWKVNATVEFTKLSDNMLVRLCTLFYQMCQNQTEKSTKIKLKICCWDKKLDSIDRYFFKHWQSYGISEFSLWIDFGRWDKKMRKRRLIQTEKLIAQQKYLMEKSLLLN